ncbi:hypothetical protein [Spiroplasma endosymbiont of Nomada ruficornis]|uniref:hypothetical protein n=1 Tax=Spiroplasma endosymbiont of Nomada ruficornis TaxID=3066325 RepID=UPI00313B8819
MKFLYENFLQFYLLALTSIIQRFTLEQNPYVKIKNLEINNKELETKIQKLETEIQQLKKKLVQDLKLKNSNHG